MKRVLVILASGAEEMETVIVVDTLRRAGLEVCLAGLEGPQCVTCSRGVQIVPDRALAEVKEFFEAVVLPGGLKGAQALAGSAAVRELLQAQDRRGGLIGAICAAPIALVAAGVARGRALTSHPSVREIVAPHGNYSEDRVVREGNVITSRGPGTALEFALALIEALLDQAAAAQVAEPMLVK